MFPATAVDRPAAAPRAVPTTLSEEEFLGLLAVCDEFDLLALTPRAANKAAERLAEHPLAKWIPVERIEAKGRRKVQDAVSEGGLPLHTDGTEVAGAVFPAHDSDEALAAPVLLENLACKASGVLAQWLPGAKDGHFVLYNAPGAMQQATGFIRQLMDDRVGRVPAP